MQSHAAQVGALEVAVAQIRAFELGALELHATHIQTVEYRFPGRQGRQVEVADRAQGAQVGIVENRRLAFLADAVDPLGVVMQHLAIRHGGDVGADGLVGQHAGHICLRGAPHVGPGVDQHGVLQRGARQVGAR